MKSLACLHSEEGIQDMNNIQKKVLMFSTIKQCNPTLYVFVVNRGRTFSTSVVVLVLVLVAESELSSTHSGSVAGSVWVLALAHTSLLLKTEPHIEVVSKATQFL